MTLKASIERTTRLSKYPVPPANVKTRLDKAAENIGATVQSVAAGKLSDHNWDTIAARMNFSDLSSNTRRDIWSAVARIWTDNDRKAFAAPLIQFGFEARRKSFDREIVLAYLRYFPLSEPAFPVLEAAAGGAAERHDWPWRARGRAWNLWNSQEGPKTLGAAIMQTDQPFAILREAGLDGELEAGAFATKVLDNACLKAAAIRGADAELTGRRLVVLFENLRAGGDNALLAHALLSPWTNGNPTEKYRKTISKVLVERVGDPRFNNNAWAAIAEALRQRELGLDPYMLIAVLRRWLTQETVRAFFRIVGATTDRKDQWDAREAFWLAYLDAGHIQDAWFAFGRRAETVAGGQATNEGMRFGRVMGGGDPSHSALIMTLGNLRIAEWSHNGACRFWPTTQSEQAAQAYGSARAPLLYQNTYEGGQLRATLGPSGFDYKPHMTGWQDTFARLVYRATGIEHPRHGQGTRW